MMKLSIVLALSSALLLTACFKDGQYPISGEECGPNDPVKDMTFTECGPTI